VRSVVVATVGRWDPSDTDQITRTGPAEDSPKGTRPDTRMVKGEGPETFGADTPAGRPLTVAVRIVPGSGSVAVAVSSSKLPSREEADGVAAIIGADPPPPPGGAPRPFESFQSSPSMYVFG